MVFGSLPALRFLTTQSLYLSTPIYLSLYIFFFFAFGNIFGFALARAAVSFHRAHTSLWLLGRHYQRASRSFTPLHFVPRGSHSPSLFCSCRVAHWALTLNTASTLAHPYLLPPWYTCLWLAVSLIRGTTPHTHVCVCHCGTCAKACRVVPIWFLYDQQIGNSSSVVGALAFAAFFLFSCFVLRVVLLNVYIFIVVVLPRWHSLLRLVFFLVCYTLLVSTSSGFFFLKTEGVRLTESSDCLGASEW